MRSESRRNRPALAARFTLLLLFALASAIPIATARAEAQALAASDSLDLPSLPPSADARGVVEADRAQVRARLLVGEHAGRRRVGVLFDLAPGWHLYWRNPGGTGIAPTLGLSASPHVVGAIDWPSPQTFVESGGLFTTWGYEGSVLLSAPFYESAAQTGATEVTAEVRVLVCRTQCVPADFALRSPLAPELSAIDRAKIDRRFNAALARAPSTHDELGIAATARWRGAAPAIDETGTLELALELCEPNAATESCPRIARDGGGSLFLPHDGDRFEWSAAAVGNEHSGDRRVVLDVELTRLEAMPASGDRLRGLVPVRDATGRLRHVALDVPIGASASAEVPTGALPPGGGEDAGALTNVAAASDGPTLLRWLQVLLLALVGGLILNGMPCVLPVLAIKVVAVADLAEKDPREVRLHGIAYGVGVLGSMALLAALVVALRSAGHSVGWGFQFQEPLFVAAIAAVLVTFAMNLFGAFEIDLGQARLASLGQDAVGARRSFFEGLLAVVLATPCTAPFLGTAVGFAFASSGLGILAIFLAIGLGLASPFLLVSFQPKAARFIPRSGPWMNTLRAGLGFSLLATCVWLLWVLGQSGGVSAVVGTTGMLVFLAFLLFCFGRLQPVRSAALGRAVAIGIAGIAVAGFNLVDYDRLLDDEGTGLAGPIADDGWQTYSEAAVAEALAAGRPAFVVFTADWCLTCKMNEATVLERDAVHAAFRAADYALFEADWTRRDEGIRRKLAEFGRAGVPLYLVYSPDRPATPRVLSELLSTGEVLAALDAASTAARR